MENNIEVIGIIVFTCPNCNSKYVCNTESIKLGLSISCSCGWNRLYQPGTTVSTNINEAVCWGKNYRDGIPIPDIPVQYNRNGWEQEAGDFRTATEIIRDNKFAIRKCNNSNRNVKDERPRRKRLLKTITKRFLYRIIRQ